MITKFALADELATSMEQELKPFEKKEIPQNLAKAVDYLHTAAEIFEEAGLTKKADQVLSVLSKLAQQGKSDELNAESKGHRATNVMTHLPAVNEMLRSGITLSDFAKMNQGDIRSRAKINHTLYEMGFNPKQIAEVLGIKNVMSRTDAALGNPHSSSSALLRMIKNPLGPDPGSEVESGDEIAIESLASKHKKPKDPRKISDPHTKGLTPEKMVKNLLHHGTEFNMADDGLADGLLELDINDADLEVLENDILSEMDFEDET